MCVLRGDGTLHPPCHCLHTQARPVPSRVGEGFQACVWCRGRGSPGRGGAAPGRGAYSSACSLLGCNTCTCVPVCVRVSVHMCLYVCVPICVYMCFRVCACAHPAHTCACVCTGVHICACVPVCLYTDMIMPVHVHEYTLMRVFLCVCLYHVKTCVHMCLYVCTCMRVCPGWAQTGGGSSPRACVPAGREWEKPWLTVGAHSLYIAGLCTHAAISVSLLLGQGEGRESSPPKNTARSASHAACLPRLVWNPGAIAPSLPAPSPGPATGAGSLRTLVQSGETEA